MSLDITRKYLNAYLEGKNSIGRAEEAGVLMLVKAWFEAYKRWEFDDQFLKAFKEGRMSIRQGPVSKTYKDDFSVKRLGELQSQGYPGHQYSVGMDSLKERLKPDNFLDNHEAIDRAERLKYKMGLHDLSASLLNPRKPTISEQQRWKHSGEKRDRWIAIFMPLPQPLDLALFHQLNTLAKRSATQCPSLYAELVDIRSKMTRVKLAAPVDMSAGLRNIAPAGAPPHFSYGLKRPLGPNGGLTGEDQARYEFALHYTDILSFQTGSSNEIVIAYRRHASTRFPLFARWNDTDQVFVCVKDEESSTSIPAGFIPDAWEKTVQVVGA